MVRASLQPEKEVHVHHSKWPLHHNPNKHVQGFAESLQQTQDPSLFGRVVATWTTAIQLYHNILSWFGTFLLQRFCKTLYSRIKTQDSSLIIVARSNNSPGAQAYRSSYHNNFRLHQTLYYTFHISCADSKSKRESISIVLVYLCKL